MVILIHQQAKRVVKILKDDKELPIENYNCITTFWILAERFPDEIIAWCEEKFVAKLQLQNWKKIFHHDLIMASYGIETFFLPDSIGYVDQLPFVNYTSEVSFATWRMSRDVGGIKGRTLIEFKNHFSHIIDFEFLINSIAKTGQQNGLLCYSNPGLISSCPEKKLSSTASMAKLFEFVYTHYKTIWSIILFWCYLRYERKYLIMPFLYTLGKRKVFQKEVDFSNLNIQSKNLSEDDFSIDVIIPTIGRAEHLFNILKDLRDQSFLPQNVIVVEQNPKINSQTDLTAVLQDIWPFQLIHHFIRETGVCNARNIAIEKVTSNWIFFADDDIRIGRELLKDAMNEIKKYDLSAINMNCKQPGEKNVFHKIKQWGSFGSGTSIVKSSFAKKCKFSLIYENGYGEDMDFGMQLRNLGCDIIYHPNINILHLKAPIGGFRHKSDLDWANENPLPKPSPTLMVYALKYFTPFQLKGYKIALFLKFYKQQSIKNPFNYFRNMNNRWKKSEKWAKILLRNNSYKKDFVN